MIYLRITPFICVHFRYDIWMFDVIYLFQKPISNPHLNSFRVVHKKCHQFCFVHATFLFLSISDKPHKSLFTFRFLRCMTISLNLLFSLYLPLGVNISVQRRGSNYTILSGWNDKSFGFEQLTLLTVCNVLYVVRPNIM